jgi:hypothetical protein
MKTVTKTVDQFAGRGTRSWSSHVARLRNWAIRLLALTVAKFDCLTGPPHKCDGWPNEIWGCPLEQARHELETLNVDEGADSLTEDTTCNPAAQREER